MGKIALAILFGGITIDVSQVECILSGDFQVNKKSTIGIGTNEQDSSGVHHLMTALLNLPFLPFLISYTVS
jgi:hypothetical protein